MIGTRYDAIVAGAGPAGAATALVLARRGASVLLVDPAGARCLRYGESLPPAAHPLIAELGLTAQLAAAGHLRSSGSASAWGGPALATRDFVFDVHGHGLHLDRRRFDADLRAAACAAGAELLEGVRVEPGAAAGEVSLGGCAVAARWLVDATGRSAAVARRLGGRRLADDGLVAFVAELAPAAPDRDRDGRLVVEACAEGWWYSMLTPAGTRAVAFLGDRDLVDARRWLSRGGFAAGLAATGHVGPLLAAHGYTLAGRPRGTSAASGRLAPYRGTWWLAVGDAALAFDPLSSQGLFHALYTGLRGGQAIAEALAGTETALAAYEARLGEIRTAYLRNRATYYAAEQRWPDHPFWRRRRATS